MHAASTSGTTYVGCGPGSVTRILAVADTTENWTWETVRAAGNVDIILSLGDMYRSDLERLNGGAPIFGVYGNHCSYGYIASMGALELTSSDTPATWNRLNNGVSILGVSGCVRYNNAAHHQWTQEEYLDALEGAPRADWVVTHCPPRGVNDHTDHAHVGIDALREYVETHAPAHLFHGHTYPDEPLVRVGDTAIHYVHGWDILDV